MLKDKFLRKDVFMMSFVTGATLFPLLPDITGDLLG